MNRQLQDTITIGITVALGALVAMRQTAKYVNYLASPPKPKRPGYRLPSLPR